MISIKPIVDDLLPYCNYTRTGRKLKSVDCIVWHWVEFAGSSASATRAWLAGQCDKTYLKRVGASEGRFGSAQFGIDLDGTVYRWIPEDEEARSIGHVSQYGRQKYRGFLNQKSLNIEFTHRDWSGQPTPATEESAIRLTAKLLKEHGLGVDRMELHSDLTGKGITNGRPCHKWYFQNRGEWKRVKEAVNALL